MADESLTVCGPVGGSVRRIRENEGADVYSTFGEGTGVMGRKGLELERGRDDMVGTVVGGLGDVALETELGRGRDDVEGRVVGGPGDVA